MSEKSSRKAARDLSTKMLKKDQQHASAEFFVPYSSDTKLAIVKVADVACKFNIVGLEGNGYGIFQQIDSTCAKYIKEADQKTIRSYFQLLPQLNFILACNTNIGWCGYPLNLESAKKKINLEQEIIIRNAPDVEQFDVVSARYDGLRFWHESLLLGKNPAFADELRGCFSVRTSPSLMHRRFKAIANLSAEHKKTFNLALSSWQIFQKKNPHKIKEMLDHGGGELKTYEIEGKNIELLWQAQNEACYPSFVDHKTLSVISAGICFNENEQFHSKDLSEFTADGQKRTSH